MSDQPLAEVFGYPITNTTPEAARARRLRLCPFHNVKPQCTKNSESDPLGVCSVLTNGHAVITCPVRFRQEWLILENAADFFFGPNARWASLSEVRLSEANGGSAGNIDYVLVALDSYGRITDFGALEVQAVYISGNIRNPFAYFMDHQNEGASFNWHGQLHYPRPDFLSSSRKRLAPQLLYKGGILKAWEKKTAVAIDDAFFETLPSLPQVAAADADVAWFVYHLSPDSMVNKYQLIPVSTIYTTFGSALDVITRADPGPLDEFVATLQKKLADNGSTTPSLDSPAGS